MSYGHYSNRAYPKSIGRKLVGVERFELPTSWSQTRRATKLRYTPVERRNMRLALRASHLWSDYPNGANRSVPAYPRTPACAARTSCDMTAFLFTQAAVPACGAATRWVVYRLLCRATKACGPPCDAASKTLGLGPRAPWLSRERDPGLRHCHHTVRRVFPFISRSGMNRQPIAWKATALH